MIGRYWPTELSPISCKFPKSPDQYVSSKSNPITKNTIFLEVRTRFCSIFFTAIFSHFHGKFTAVIVVVITCRWFQLTDFWDVTTCNQRIRGGRSPAEQNAQDQYKEQQLRQLGVCTPQWHNYHHGSSEPRLSRRRNRNRRRQNQSHRTLAGHPHSILFSLAETRRSQWPNPASRSYFTCFFGWVI